MFRRAHVRFCSAEKFEQAAMQISVGQIVGALGVAVTGFGLVRSEFKADIQELKASADKNTAELNVKRAEIGLRQQRELLIDTRRATASAIAATGLQQAILQKQLAQQEALLAQTRVTAPFAASCRPAPRRPSRSCARRACSGPVYARRQSGRRAR